MENVYVKVSNKTWVLIQLFKFQKKCLQILQNLWLWIPDETKKSHNPLVVVSYSSYWKNINFTTKVISYKNIDDKLYIKYDYIIFLTFE